MVMTNHLSMSGNTKVKIIWRPLNKVIFDDIADNILDWEDAEIYYVVQWYYDSETATYNLETI